jgi:hypothetical protein
MSKQRPYIIKVKPKSLQEGKGGLFQCMLPTPIPAERIVTWDHRTEQTVVPNKGPVLLDFN